MAALELEAVGIAISAGGFVLTVGGAIVAVTRAIDLIKINADKRIQEIAESERRAREAAFIRFEERFRAEQEVQNHNFGEVGLALRQFITDIEKKLFQIEIWARDRLALPLADVIKDVRHLKRNFEMHQQIYKDLSDEVIRLQKDVERLTKAINGKH